MTTIEAGGRARTAAQVLTETHALVQPALRAAVDTLPDSMRLIAGYHFGWSDEQGRPAPAGRGKALRPALALLSAEVVGAPPVDAIPAAVAVELVHNFSLLHDDVMDGDHTRRHRPTAWRVFGTGPAILAGDALLALALDVLGAAGRNGRRAARLLADSVQRLIEGQSADLSFEQRADVGLPECLAMAERKTGALLGCACAVGAMLGHGGSDQVQRMRGFGERLGLAFQLVDDLLGIWGDPEITGKPVHSDLRNRKKSLPVVAALSSGTPVAGELDLLYHRAAPLSEVDAARAADFIEQAGGRDWSRKAGDELLAQALEVLPVGPKPRACEELAALARTIMRRDR